MQRWPAVLGGQVVLKIGDDMTRDDEPQPEDDLLYFTCEAEQDRLDAHQVTTLENDDDRVD